MAGNLLLHGLLLGTMYRHYPIIVVYLEPPDWLHISTESHQLLSLMHAHVCCTVYSGAPLIRTSLGLEEVAGLAKCPLFRG